MKAVTVVALLVLCCACNVYSAPPDADKQPAAPSKPSLRFSAYNGDPRKTDPKDMHFQVNSLDLRRPTEFLKLGDIVSGTKFKLTKFEFKTRPNPKGGDEDVSELTITHIETKETTVLVIGGR